MTRCLPPNRFDARLKYVNHGVAVSAARISSAIVRRKPVGVGVGFEEAESRRGRTVLPLVVIDRPADEHGRGAHSGCAAIGFRRFPIWTIPAFDGAAGWVRHRPGARFDFQLVMTPLSLAGMEGSCSVNSVYTLTGS